MRSYQLVTALLSVAVLYFGYYCDIGNSGLALASGPSNITPEGQTGDWALLFSDEFDGSLLDTDKWSTCFPWGGTDGCTLTSSEDLQWYQSDSVSVQDGVLKLKALNRQVTTNAGETYDYTSGMVNTGWDLWNTVAPPKFSFRYGFAEVRAKVPEGTGLWPSFWMLAADQVWPPEIDVMAVAGGRPRTNHMRAFYSRDDGNWGRRSRTWTGPDFSSRWHTFAVDWQETAIIWYVDGIERGRFTDAAHVPSEAMYLILSLAVGGGSSGSPASDAPFPSYFEVDYVRVWRREGATPSPTDTPAPTGTPTAIPSSERVLLFSDDFDGTSLDTDKWFTCYPWDYDGCTNAGNNELQWYTPDNVLVEDGTLRLRARKETIDASDGNTYHYTSGMVATGPDSSQIARFTFKYGFVEVRARIPRGQGLWSAFWLLPLEYARLVELDVMEITGDQPNVQLMSVHYLTPGGNPRTSNRTWAGPDFSMDWHTFAVDWQPTAITWYVDGVERWRTTVRMHIPHEPMFLVGNLAVGGDYPGPPDWSTPFPSYCEIDYVKVWNRAP